MSKQNCLKARFHQAKNNSTRRLVAGIDSQIASASPFGVTTSPLVRMGCGVLCLALNKCGPSIWRYDCMTHKWRVAVFVVLRASCVAFCWNCKLLNQHCKPDWLEDGFNILNWKGSCRWVADILLNLYWHHVTEGTESISDRFPMISTWNSIQWCHKAQEQGNCQKGTEMDRTQCQDEARGTERWSKRYFRIA